MNSSSDTIIALATPRGYSGVGVIRMSGPDALPFLEQIFQPIGSSSLIFPDRKAVYGTVHNPENSTVVDDGIALVMKGPRSYTGEDVVELSLHGSPLVLDKVQQILVSLGARPAGRGEFTRRAFLSGRLDLIQAEAVIDLIEAGSLGAAAEARTRLDKSLSTAVLAVSSQLKDLLATVEAHIDFDEDEEEPLPDLLPPIRSLLDAMETLLAHAGNARITREGIRLAIVGKPNVGKSTLFNSLLKADRAIVTPHAGTTRDSLEERLMLSGMPFVLSDTAGIRENPEPVEEEGIRRTRKRVDEADIVMIVLDGSQPIDGPDLAVLEECRSKAAIIVLNKMDLGLAIPVDSEILGPPERSRLAVSARSGQGLDELEELLAGIGNDLSADVFPPQTGALTQRGILLMSAAQQPPARIKAQIEETGSWTPELVSIELRNALNPLEEITGERWDEGILDRIFERFCVGK